MKPNRLIDIALLGWPRCGTSSLFEWMDAHPSIVGSRPKETNYFFDEGHPLCGSHGRSIWTHDREGYDKFFPSSREALKLDGSVHTFCQETSLRFFSTWEGPLFFVAVLRQPADRIHSAFRYTQGNLGAIDRRLDFPTYVDALLQGQADDLVAYYASNDSFWIAKRELEFSRYVEWLERWNSIVGSESLGIVLSENLWADPGRTMRQLCAKLSLDHGSYESYNFQSQNSSITPRSQRIHRFVRRFGRHIPSSRTKSTLNRAYNWMQIDADEDRHDPRDADALRKLDEYFAPWNKMLANRFGIDLRLWKVNR